VQASLADIFLWENFKRAMKARNYTSYKLQNPWPVPAPFSRLGTRSPPKGKAHKPRALGDRGRRASFLLSPGTCGQVLRSLAGAAQVDHKDAGWGTRPGRAGEGSV
jgi:hypothetical protein